MGLPQRRVQAAVLPVQVCIYVGVGTVWSERVGHDRASPRLLKRQDLTELVPQLAAMSTAERAAS